ncbi:enoyl-CoA hydratase-related protein [Streptomyces cynarae]|uniref:Enoyl-CoA hydratase-related protein n=1 Tax=Streptomyces cynarae TaxID=2981134 RepID=A0ABY6DU86_9ACTN|nr:enoyl-CoA hydratase-related protein [Streptomyces cynarae]UXY17941.1 enoyl-CoA hydratase-related protein [Streptomyces cynarae]
MTGTGAVGVRHEECNDVRRHGAAGARADGAISVRRDGAVATVRVGTGRRANALAIRDWRALAAVFEALGQDPSLGAVVVSGRGSATFSAGSDMREWLSARPAEIDASFAAM